MKIQDWDRWHRDRQATQDTIQRFSRACEASRGYAYEAGWLTSTLNRVLMDLPRARREEEIRMLADQTKMLEAEQIMSTLMNKE